MKTMKTFIVAATISALSTASIAGGLSDQIMEAPVAAEEEMAPAGSSLDPTLIVLGILGLLLLGANAGDDNGGGGQTIECPPPNLCELVDRSDVPDEPAT